MFSINAEELLVENVKRNIVNICRCFTVWKEHYARFLQEKNWKVNFL